MEPSGHWYAHLLVSDARRNRFWLRGELQHPQVPTAEQVYEGLRHLCPYSPTPPLDLHLAHLFAVPDVPRPPPGDLRALRRWRVEVDFVCHDIRAAGVVAGVFTWPERPQGATLGEMARWLIIEQLAKSGDGPEYVDYADVRGSSVEEAAP